MLETVLPVHVRAVLQEGAGVYSLFVIYLSNNFVICHIITVECYTPKGETGLIHSFLFCNQIILFFIQSSLLNVTRQEGGWDLVARVAVVGVKEDEAPFRSPEVHLTV